MKKNNPKLIKKKLKRSQSYGYGHNINLRKKSLANLDTKIKASFSNLNDILNRINDSKEEVLYNKFQFIDLKSLENLDNNILLLCNNLRNEAKYASKLSYGYNLGSLELDNFLSNLEKKHKKKLILKSKEKEKEVEKVDYNNEFNLASLGKDKKEKLFNNSFIKEQKRMRDLYNLKLELKLIDEKKKIGEKKTFETLNKAPNCLLDRDKRKNPRYSRIKSKYFSDYQLSKSFELEDGLIEANILNEQNKLEEENEKENNKEEVFITNNTKENNKYLNTAIINNHKKSIIKEKKEDKNFLHITKRTNILLNQNIDSNNNQDLSTKKKSIISRNVKNQNFNNSAIIKSNSNDSSNFKSSIRLKLKSGHNISRNNNVSSLYKKIYKNNFGNRNFYSRQKSQMGSGPTIYSSVATSRPISSFTNFNSTVYHHFKKESNKSSSDILSSKKKFKNYINNINKIIRYSNYSTDKFKKSTKELNKKELFVKSTNKIFEKKKNLNIDKIVENLKLDKNPHSFINDKKLIYNNSLKVKLMLNLKNREILNTVILTLLDEQRRVNNFFIDATLYEKMMKKFERNKTFNLLSNKIINFEKKHDKERILDMFDKTDENIINIFNKKENKERYNEKEYKFELIKNKNMKIMDNNTVKKTHFNGNLHKKHLVAKYKKN